MNRCVRIIDTDGIRILPTAGRAVKIGTEETFRDVFSKVAPGSEMQGMAVQLTLKVGSPAEDAMDTEELDEKVHDIVQLCQSSQGYDPMIITYLVARVSPDPACGCASPPSTQTAAAAELTTKDHPAEKIESFQPAAQAEEGAAPAGAVDTSHREQPGSECPSNSGPALCDETGGDSSGVDTEEKPDMHCREAPGLSGERTEAGCAVAGPSVNQHFITIEEVARHHGVDDVPAAAKQFIAYLIAHNCAFLPDEPRYAVLTMVLEVLVHITPPFLNSVQQECRVAHSHLSTLAATFRPAHTGEDDLTTSTATAIRQAVHAITKTDTVLRVLSRREWRPVECFLTAMEEASSVVLGCLRSGREPEATQEAAWCCHCGTECKLPRVGQKRSAPPAAEHGARPAPGAPLREVTNTAAASGACGKPAPSRKYSSYTVVDSECQEASLKPTGGRRAQCFRGALSKTLPQPLADWEPCAEAIVYVDPSFKSVKAFLPHMIFPYGFVSISRYGGRKREWLAWRLPVCTGKDLRAAHERMAAFFENDPDELRRQARRRNRYGDWI